MKLKEILRFFKKYFQSEHKLFIKSFILIVISSALSLLYGYMLGRALDYAAIGAFGSAIALLVLNIVFDISDSLFFDKYGRIYLERLCNNMMEAISFDVFYKVGLLPARAFEEKTSGELINRITNDSGTITDTFKQLLRAIISLSSSLIVFIYICFNSLVVAIEVLIYLVIFYLFSKKYLPKIREAHKKMNKEKDKVVAEVNESIRGIREIRALGIRNVINGNIKEIISKLFFHTNTQMIDERSYWAVISVLNICLENIVFITCIVLIILGVSTYAFLMSMTYYIYRFMNTVEMFMSLSTSFEKMGVAIERIDEILANKTYQDDTFGNVHKTDIKGHIIFKNVSFKYNNEEDYTFKNLNLEIPANKKIAIVGKSGQGKTTIFNLLLRYFDVESGVILIDDIPIKDFDEESFHENIAIIRQDPFLFNKSILDNFKVIDKYMSLKKIREACKRTQIDDYIMSLPKKYDTLIGEGGINLSGGQKQRIAIARALLKGSKIILFDEATSALDNENQAKIKETIDSLVKDHTIIIVAHRLSTIIDADIIYLVDQGSIVASGTHKELYKNNKIYKSLYKNEK